MFFGKSVDNMRGALKWLRAAERCYTVYPGREGNGTRECEEQTMLLSRWIADESWRQLVNQTQAVAAAK